MNFMEILLIAILVFIASIIIVTILKECTVKDATLLCCNFIKEVLAGIFNFFFRAKNEIIYPSIVGYDHGVIVLTSVDKEFEKVRNNFETCYCTNAKYLDDYVFYDFSIQRKPNSYDDDTLIELIQKESEEVVAQNMRMYNCFKSASELTTIELLPNTLTVYYARTSKGIEIIAEMKKAKQLQKGMVKVEHNSSMTENWE